jgi:hypothetical protein
MSEEIKLSDSKLKFVLEYNLADGCVTLEFYCKIPDSSGFRPIKINSEMLDILCNIVHDTVDNYNEQYN